jgi:hypothetical protein
MSPQPADLRIVQGEATCRFSDGLMTLKVAFSLADARGGLFAANLSDVLAVTSTGSSAEASVVRIETRPEGGPSTIKLRPGGGSGPDGFTFTGATFSVPYEVTARADSAMALQGQVLTSPFADATIDEVSSAGNDLSLRLHFPVATSTAAVVGIDQAQLSGPGSCPVKWLSFVTAIPAPHAIAASISVGSSPPSSSSTFAIEPMLK